MCVFTLSSACQCYGHSDECVFDEEVERQRLSIDIHGNYEGGGVCQNCQVGHLSESSECTSISFPP